MSGVVRTTRHPYADVWRMVGKALSEHQSVWVTASLLGLYIPLDKDRRREFYAAINEAIFHPRGMVVELVSVDTGQLHVRSL